MGLLKKKQTDCLPLDRTHKSSHHHLSEIKNSYLQVVQIIFAWGPVINYKRVICRSTKSVLYFHEWVFGDADSIKLNWMWPRFFFAFYQIKSWGPEMFYTSSEYCFNLFSWKLNWNTRISILSVLGWWQNIEYSDWRHQLSTMITVICSKLKWVDIERLRWLKPFTSQTYTVKGSSSPFFSNISTLHTL